MKNMSFIIIPYDPAAMPSGMLTIDQFLTIVCLPLFRLLPCADKLRIEWRVRFVRFSAYLRLPK